MSQPSPCPSQVVQAAPDAWRCPKSMGVSHKGGSLQAAIALWKQGVAPLPFPSPSHTRHALHPRQTFIIRLIRPRGPARAAGLGSRRGRSAARTRFGGELCCGESRPRRLIKRSLKWNGLRTISNLHPRGSIDTSTGLLPDNGMLMD